MVGGAGTPLWAGRILDQDPNLQVRGNWFDSETGRWGLGRKMLLDPYVRAAIEGITDPIYAADHDFEPANDTPIAAEIADWCRYVFFEENSWSKFLQKSFGYFRDGSAILECTDDMRPFPRDRFTNHPEARHTGLGLIYTGFHERPIGTIDRVGAWIQDSNDPTQLIAVRQYIQGSDAEAPGYAEISADKFIRFTWGQEAADFRGFAPVRVVYGPWYRKINLVAIAMIAHERHHVGVPTIIWDEVSNLPQDEIQKTKEALLEMRAHQKGMLMLRGVKSFEFASAKGGTDIESAIKDANFEIMFPFGGNFQLLGSSGGNGSYALADTQSGTRHVITHRHVDFIDDTINFGSDGWSLVERCVRANYGPDAPIPRKVTRNVPTANFQQLAAQLPSLKAAGFIKSTVKDERTLRKWMLLDARSPKDEIIEAPGEAAPAAIEGEVGATVADVTFNGAQVQAAIDGIVLRVAQKQIPRDAAVAQLQVFFRMTPEEADQVLGEIGKSFFVEQELVPIAPAGPGPATAPRTGAEEPPEPEEQDVP